MSINLNDFIIKKKRHYFKATCNTCGSDRGYKTRGQANNLCPRCNCIKAGKASAIAQNHKIHHIKPCSINGCTANTYSHNYCVKHYKELIINKNPKNEQGLLNLTCRNCGKIFQSSCRKGFYCSDTCNAAACNKRRTEEQKQAILALRRERNSKRSDEQRKIDKDRSTKWRENNKDKIKAYRSIPSVKIGLIARCRLSKALKRQQKTSRLCEYLGCSLGEVKLYLESKFLPGMTWENHGLYGWHIDHIKPLASFDLTNPEQIKIACHYTNLQPLWAKDNISKGDKHVNN